MGYCDELLYVPKCCLSLCGNDSIPLMDACLALYVCNHHLPPRVSLTLSSDHTATTANDCFAYGTCRHAWAGERSRDVHVLAEVHSVPAKGKQPAHTEHFPAAVNGREVVREPRRVHHVRSTCMHM